MNRLFYNEDCNSFFSSQTFPKGKEGEVIDRYVDVVAGAGVTVFLCNTNVRRTNYQSTVWESFWDGFDFDPAWADRPPFIGDREEWIDYRKCVGNMLAVHKQGIDYPARVLQRCRHRGVSPWISLRMNDCHYNAIPNHPFHGSFWVKHPQFGRKDSFAACCLDYAHPEVRDFYQALVVETLERYDIDGLELDFMREPYVFSAGQEAADAPLLTAWIRDVRALATDAAAKRGHPIRLGVRVPSRPETALGMGLDAIAWAQEGLIDLLVACPHWSTLEFDMPIERWREALGGANVTLAGGLEINYQPCPGGETSLVSPELARGAACSVLSHGADAVYLFNYFPSSFSPVSAYQDLLKSMASLEALLKLPRRIGVTYRDFTAPGEKYQAPLPAIGNEVRLAMKLGPIPDRRWRCDLLVGVMPPQGAGMPIPAVLVNGKPCEFRAIGAEKSLALLSFSVPPMALAPTEAQEIKVVSGDLNALNLQRLEAVLRPA